jgi:hypothetical protein
MEKSMYRRESLSGAYSAAAYETAWYLRSVLMGLLRGIIFSPFVYWYACACVPVRERERVCVCACVRACTCTCACACPSLSLSAC